MRVYQAIKFSHREDKARYICAFDILNEQPRRVVFALWLNNKLFLDGLLDVVLDRSVNLFNDCDRNVVFARQRYNEK